MWEIYVFIEWYGNKQNSTNYPEKQEENDDENEK